MKFFYVTMISAVLIGLMIPQEVLVSTTFICSVLREICSEADGYIAEKRLRTKHKSKHTGVLI